MPLPEQCPLGFLAVLDYSAADIFSEVVQEMKTKGSNLETLLSAFTSHLTVSREKDLEPLLVSIGERFEEVLDYEPCPNLFSEDLWIKFMSSGLKLCRREYTLGSN